MKDAKRTPGFFRYTRPLYGDIGKHDERRGEYLAFKKENGFSPDECWDLATALAEFLLPRLEYFRAHLDSYPPDLATVEDWGKILDEIIWLLRERLYDWESPAPAAAYRDYAAYAARRKAASALFGKYWEHFWS